MPWWGWLIAGGVVFLGLCWVLVVTIWVKSFRSMSAKMDADHEQWREDHGFNRFTRR